MGLPRIAPYPLPAQAELPAPRATWQPRAERLALLVHDMQRYFLAPYAPDAAPLGPAIANLARLLERSRALGVPVFYTAQKGNQERCDRGLQADLWGPGMRASAEHEAIVEELAPRAGEHVLVKHRYSAFQRSNLETLMRARGRDQLLVTGVYAHIGCTATVVEAFQRDIEPFIAADAVADFSREDHDQALRWIARTCGVPMSTEALLEVLR
ncbi:isochorismatase family protein [Pseudothauera nasutitermitis]|uniref:Isochorismatase family protein n=1 Tax=Pseudothauera nasutitermitis TaxID=2565930 RepID=A0A4S4AX93_9RHOO|nr:isochorismatase family protein [Pseudothauera nasutitermitis]THF64520.1 isochorismatase family protein [Pseudothauera nasutitermitis]